MGPPDGSKEVEKIQGSPFLDATPLTAYERAKIVLMAPVALVRALCLLVLANVASAVAWVAFQWNTDYDAFDAALIRLFRAAGAVAGLSVVTRGEEHLRRAEDLDRCIAVFNHVSALDWIVLLRYRVFAFVTHVAFTAVPLAAPLFAYARFILIRPCVPTAPIVMRRAGTDPMVALAPEGTLSHGGCLLRFHTGAFAALAPVLPVLLRYPFRHHNPAWTVETHVALRLYRILTQVVTPVHVEFLPVVAPLPGETPAAFAQRVRAIMADAMGVPMVDQGKREREREALLVKNGG